MSTPDVPLSGVPTVPVLQKALARAFVLNLSPEHQYALAKAKVNEGMTLQDLELLVRYATEMSSGPGVAAGVLTKLLNRGSAWREVVATLQDCYKPKPRKKPDEWPSHYNANDAPNGGCVHGKTQYEPCDDCERGAIRPGNPPPSGVPLPTDPRVIGEIYGERK